MLLILMFSLAGVPPMAGFHAKLSVLAAIIAQGYWWVAVLAVLFSVAGLYYALRVIWLMYFEAPTEQTPVNAAWDMQLALSANALLILGLGLYPAGLMAYCINLLT
jgi:NADH-quinone oxidoreductase subunit N